MATHAEMTIDGPTTRTGRSVAEGTWLGRFALVVAAATFLLLVVGGAVTSYDVGMAVPDWPTTYGENMFLYSWADAPWGVRLEHAHRLLGATVGLLAIVLAAWLWLAEPRLWLRWLGTAALAAVVLQGVLGGLRVVQIDRRWGVVHACLAQGICALMAAIALFTSRSWKQPSAMGAVPASDIRRVSRLGTLTTGMIVATLVFGAMLRHLGVGWSWHRLLLHMLLALSVMVHVFLLARRVATSNKRIPVLGRLAQFLVAIVCAQLALGIGALVATNGMAADSLDVATTTQAVFTTAHTVVGALLLAGTLLLTLESYRLVSVSGSPVGTLPGAVEGTA